MVLLLVTGFFFAIAYSNEFFIQITKLASVSSKIYRQSYYVSRVQLINRMAAPVVLFSIAYFIDTNSDSQRLKDFIIALLLIKLVFTFSMFRLYTLLTKSIDSKFRLIPEIKDVKLLGLSFLSNTSILFGAMLPLYLSEVFEGYRATIMQSGTLLNAVGTLVGVFWVDRMLSDYSESYQGSGEENSKVLGSIGFVLLFAKLCSLVMALFLALVAF